MSDGLVASSEALSSCTFKKLRQRGQARYPNYIVERYGVRKRPFTQGLLRSSGCMLTCPRADDESFFERHDRINPLQIKARSGGLVVLSSKWYVVVGLAVLRHKRYGASTRNAAVSFFGERHVCDSILF